MTSTAKTNIKAIVKLANGQQSYTLEALSQLKLTAGAQITLVDQVSGKAVTGLLAKRKGNDLVLELEGQGEVASLVDFYSSPNVAFYPSGEIPASAMASSAGAVTAETTTAAVTAAGEPVVWKAPADSGSMGWLAAGGAGLAVAGGGATALNLILGKTNVPEFALEGYTDNPVYGPTGNPWNTELTPGGSSGGAVAAAAWRRQWQSGGGAQGDGGVSLLALPAWRQTGGSDLFGIVLALGSALVLTALGEKAYAELVAHHMSMGFGTVVRADLAFGWYQMGLEAAKSGAVVFAPGLTDRTDVIYKAAYIIGGHSDPAAPAPAAAPELPAFSLARETVVTAPEAGTAP